MVDGFIGLERALDTWRDWGLPITARPSLVAPVPGGRTNRNYRVRAPGLEEDLLLRLNNPRGERLGIQRRNEVRILSTVADAGLTYDAWYWAPDYRFTVFPFVSARTWTEKDLKDDRQRQRLKKQLAVVHDLVPDTPPRRYLDYLEHYWQQLRAAGDINVELESRWASFRPRLAAFDEGGWRPVLTHHDLIPDNVLETADRLYLIDWEYAAVGHPDIDRWCLDPALVRDPFVYELGDWTNELWERVIRINQV